MKEQVGLRRWRRVIDLNDHRLSGGQTPTLNLFGGNSCRPVDDPFRKGGTTVDLTADREGESSESVSEVPLVFGGGCELAGFANHANSTHQLPESGTVQSRNTFGDVAIIARVDFRAS